MIKGITLFGLAFLAWISIGSHLDAASAAGSSDPVKIGLVVPLTGAFGPVGRRTVAGAKLYIAQHGDMAGGRKIELIVKDDTGAPDVSKRLVAELLTTEKVTIIGAGITPCALAIAPLATETKTATVIMISGTSSIVQQSPYFVRTSWTHGQQASVLAAWVAKNGARKATIIVSDWAPGAEAANVFADFFRRAGGSIADVIKVPLDTRDFAAFLQRARDSSPDTLFVFVPSSQATILAEQYVERGLDKTGIKLVGPGDITDDQDLPAMSDAMLGTVTAGYYAASHVSDLNKSFVTAYREANGGTPPSFVSAAAYDGIHLIYLALEKTGGITDGDALIAAMKGLAWESPGGPIAIDPVTRDVVHNIYIRKVERIDGKLSNVEIDTFAGVRDVLK